MRAPIVLVALAAACGGPRRPGPARTDALAARFPLARLGDRALCDRLLARREADPASRSIPSRARAAR